jgi:ATP-dependent Clp protease ATP-binding subunit ClpA
MLSPATNKIINQAHQYALAQEHEYITAEHILLYLIEDPIVKQVLQQLEVNLPKLRADISKVINENIPKSSLGKPQAAMEVQQLIQQSAQDVVNSGKKNVEPYHLFMAMFRALDLDHDARNILEQHGINKLNVAQILSHGTVVNPEAVGEMDTDAEGDSNPSKLPDYLINLNEKAGVNKIDPLIGRELEVERVIHTLVRRKKNNPLLVGEPGVGKTAIAEGLALKIVRKEVPSKLQDCIIYSLDVGSMLAGTKYRGDFEERMKKLLKLLAANPKAILFIDEIHTIIGAGAASGGGTDASNMLKPKLASGELKVIGSTTYKEYRNVFEKDAALARRFQKVDVVEPSVEDTIKILTGVKGEFENHHGVNYSPDSIKTAVELSVKHINDRFLPDKAIDLLDEAGATLSLKDQSGTVDSSLIEKMVAKIARIPEKTVSSSQKNKLKNLNSDIRMVLFGQDDAVNTVTQAIELAQSGLRGGDRPIGSFLFCGPTGVGKTELAKQLASNLGINFIRLDMSEYGEKHTVSRLIGAPPGYVGYDQEGQLTGAVMKHPHSVVLLDEIEKAHPEIYNILLQVMDHGTLTDSNGRKADFKNTVIIMTSNAGAAEASRATMGIGGVNPHTNFSYTKPIAAVEKTFTPEFRNRLDGVVFFNPLTHENVVSVLDKYILELDTLLLKKNASVEFTAKAKEYIIQRGYQPSMGARPMKRVLEDQVSRRLAKELLYGELEQGGTVTVDEEGGQLSFTFKKPLTTAGGSKSVKPKATVKKHKKGTDDESDPA